MKLWPHATLALIAVLGLSPVAHAQRTYRCLADSGAQYWSDRPCPATLGSRGTDASTQYRSGRTYYDPSSLRPQPAPEHSQYLTPACAQLLEGIRTGPARGVRGHELNDLNRDYQRKCSEDDQQARRRLSESLQAERELKQADERRRRMEQQQTREAREQCHEMLRTLHGRRQRVATMTEGEKADLARFQTSYDVRCKGTPPP